MCFLIYVVADPKDTCMVKRLTPHWFGITQLLPQLPMGFNTKQEASKSVTVHVF